MRYFIPDGVWGRCFPVYSGRMERWRALISTGTWVFWLACWVAFIVLGVVMLAC